MADEIRQQLTFDASQAIAELDKLRKSLQLSRNALNSFGKSLSNFNRNSAGVVATIQNIGIAAQTLQTQLGAGIALPQAFSQLQPAAGLVDQFGNSLKNESAAAQTAARTNTQAAQSKTKVGNAAKNAQPAVEGLTISFNTLARIITTQLTVRAIGGFIRAITSSVGSAIDFQKRIAEIQTITNNAFGSFDRAAQAVRGISDAFNQPLGEVQEGLYAIISDQIQGASNQIAVLEASAVLAKVGVADLSDTVRLLTGTINAFQLNAGRADELAAVFFETVRLGRVRVEELADTFGTVAPLASEAGISFEELAAAFATITINGVDAAKAATQLRGIVTAFIKPTKEMAALLERAGFSSGELAIQTLGLGGALALLQKHTGGSSTELAKLIPRMRGISGAMILARNDGKTLDDTLDQLRVTAQDLLKQKFSIVITTNAQQVETAINRIKNALTIDLGQSILSVIAFFARFKIITDIIIGAIQVLGPLIAGVGTAAIIAAAGIGVYITFAKAAVLANKALGASAVATEKQLLLFGTGQIKNAALASFAQRVAGLIRTALGAAIGFGIGAAVGVGLQQFTQSRAQEQAREAGKQLAKSLIEGELGAQLEAARLRRDQRIKELRESAKDAQEFLSVFARVAAVRTDLFLASSETILADTKRLLSGILDANNKLISNLKKARDDADKNIKSSLQRQSNIRIKSEDRAFNQSIKFQTDRQKLFALEQRGAQLAATANRDLAAARTEEQAEVALRQLERAEGFLQEAESIAEGTGFLGDQTRVYQARQRIAQQTIAAEQQHVNLLKSGQKITADTLAVEQKRVAALDKETTEALDAIKAFENAKTATEKLAAAREALIQIKDITPELAFGRLLTEGKVDFNQFVTFKDFIKDLEDSVKESGLTNRLDDVFGGVKFGTLVRTFNEEMVEATLTALNFAEAEANRQGFELKVKVRLDLDAPERIRDIFEQLQGANKSAQEDTDQAFDSQKENTQRTLKGRTAITESLRESNTFATNLAQGLGQLGQILTGPLQKTTEFDTKLKALVAESLLIANNFGKIDPDVATKRLFELQKALDSLLATAGLDTQAASQTTITALQLVIDKLNAANEASLSGAEQSANNINTTLGGIPAHGDAFEQEIAAAEGRMRNIASIASSITIPGVNAAATAATGGLIARFADGGFVPRGTDTIPAMLSKGEFVVNARSTRKFFSELQAINSGVRPVFRQDGGPVTNVGDINVTVAGGRDNRLTGRQIASSLRRELRRKTSSL